jgi:Entner-Doudoroff aldolase
MHEEFFSALGATGIVPVIVIQDVKDAVPLGKALCDGGLPCAEVTFRTAAAKESIATISRELPDMLVGAGTVLTTQQVDEALEAGAKFIVSPGLNPEVVTYCQSKNVPIIPGIATPSEIEQALALGLDVVKFFPAEQNGGIEKIKALAGPYTSLKFMPTGGVNAKNINDYLAFPRVVACGGTWMVPADKIAAGDWDAIVALTQQAVQTALGFEVLHVGVNAPGWSEGEAITNEFAALLGTGTRKTSKSYFAGSLIEVMTEGGKGTHGHIAFGVNHFDRAVAYLERKGYKLDESSVSRNAKGQRTFAYLTTEIGGFALHLNQK